MKQIFRLALITVVALSAVGAAFHPAVAAPNRADSAGLAALMPADIGVYSDINTTQLTDTVGLLSGLLSKAGLPVTTDLLYSQVDQQLTKALGRKATLKDDILAWLGSDIAVGVGVTDAMIKDPTAAQKSGDVPVLLIASVKDEAAADKFLAEVLALIEKQGLSFTKSTAQIAGKPATLYTNVLLKVTLVRIPGDLVIGNDIGVKDMTDTLNNNKPTLGTDTKFQKTMALLNTNNVFSAYVGSRALSYSLNAAMAGMKASVALSTGSTSASAAQLSSLSQSLTQMADLLQAYNGFAVAARADSKSVAIDVAVSADPAALKAASAKYGLPADLMTASTPLSGKLNGQISSKAVGIVEATNFARIYTAIRSALKVAANQTGMTPEQKQQADQVVQGLTQFESYLKSGFGLDIDADVLSWLGGEFAIYGYMDTNGDLVKASFGQWPFESALVIQATDTAKAKAFADKLSAGLQKNAGLTATADSNGIYTIALSPEVKLAFGVSGDNFILTTGSAVPTVTGAIGGTDTLGSSPTWKNALATMPTKYSSLAYLDLTAFAPYIEQAMSASSDSGTKIAGALYNEFESALIYATASADGSSGTSTIALTLK